MRCKVVEVQITKEISAFLGVLAYT